MGFFTQPKGPRISQKETYRLKVEPNSKVTKVNDTTFEIEKQDPDGRPINS